MEDAGATDENSAQPQQGTDGILPQNESAESPSDQQQAAEQQERNKQNRERFIYGPLHAAVSWTDQHGAAVTALATVVIAVATIVNVVYVGGQLAEMRSSSTQTEKLITSNADFAKAAKDQAAAAVIQAQAEQTSANAAIEQLAIQREVLNRTYRPRISVNFAAVGDIEISDKKFAGDVTFTAINHGASDATNVEWSVEFHPVKKALIEQDRLCREATIFQGLHLKNLEKEKLPPIYKVIQPNDPIITRTGFRQGAPIDEFKGDLPPENVNAKLILPSVVGCVAYQGADDKKIHYTRFLYFFEKRETNGGVTFITIDPQTIKTADIVVKRWPDGGNSEE